MDGPMGFGFWEAGVTGTAPHWFLPREILTLVHGLGATELCGTLTLARALTLLGQGLA
jgi:hypothetical protein